MQVHQLLSLLPETVLEELATQTNVNHYSKKLQGQVIFKLILHCLLTQKSCSLRGMESAYETLFFRLLSAGAHKEHIAISSISERLNTIQPEYFEKLYQTCVKVYKQQLGKHKENIIRFDSTIVALSTKLLTIGYQLKGGDAEHYRQLKFTVGFSNGIAETVQFYTDQSHNSENLALKETILEHKKENSKAASVRVFDKGVTARSTYDKLTEEGIVFVSTLRTTAKHTVIRKQKGSKLPCTTDTLQITADNWCQLYSEGHKRSKYLVRLIAARRLEDDQEMLFVTNTADLSATQVTEIYKSRWAIEVFFKFIKQLLNFRHLLNRSENGIKVVLYITMIAGVLLEAYKRSNNMNGYKIVLLKMSTEIEEELVKQLITLCGGDPDRLYGVLSKNIT